MKGSRMVFIGKTKKELDLLMGSNLARLRKARNLSESELAAKVDSHERYIAAMENGRGIAGWMLARLCKVLGVSEDEFVKPAERRDMEELLDRLDATTMELVKEIGKLSETDKWLLLAELKRWETKKR